MPTINVVAETSVPPQRVLEAAHDFSARRADVFPAVELEHYELHSQANSSADVTEGTRVGPFGVNWERCRYDWSQADSVSAPVTDSNVYEPASSSWEIRATEIEGGSRVEMTWIREFNGSARGRVFGTLFRVVGKQIFGRYARNVLKNLEELEAAS
jgi:hypothetical protein